MLFTEDNIQQLHEIHEALQQMRDSATLGLTHVNLNNFEIFIILLHSFISIIYFCILHYRL